MSSLSEGVGGPDVSVRTAWPQDAAALATVQQARWSERFDAPGDRLEAAGAPSIDLMTEGWRRALVAPGDARNRVLVALQHATVVGFAITTPSADPDATPGTDAEVGEFAIAAEHRGQGHGSRLMHAVVETLQADGFRRARWWIDAEDDDLRAFLHDSGWAPDGAHRELATDADSSLRQVRLHTDIAGAGD